MEVLSVPLKRDITLSLRQIYDVAVIGGGIIGTAIARRVTELFPKKHVVLLEKEDSLAKHQSGKNSGVIHAGIYYKPHSLKAQLCLQGLKLVYEYCDKNNIPYNRCGKLVVAINEREERILHDMYGRGLENGVPDLKWLNSSKEIAEIEPHCKGHKAIWSPQTGNIDWNLFTNYLARDFKANGGDIKLGYKVESIEEAQNPTHPIIINAKSDNFLRTKYLIKCVGAYSDILNTNTVTDDEPKIFSFRVAYKKWNPVRNVVRTNIYGVPNLPFLGPHISLRHDGIMIGPSAIPSLSTENHDNNQIDVSHLQSMVTYSGFSKMIMKNFPECVSQFSKFVSNDVQAAELKRMVPSLEERDIQHGPSAVQAQAIDADGNFVDDFIFRFFKGEGINKRIIDCRFVPSPGATSCLAISKMVTDKLTHLHDI